MRASGTNCIAPGQPPDDLNGHGTHCAGTIGALNVATSSGGTAGVAPGTRVVAVKVCCCSVMNLLWPTMYYQALDCCML
jgi:hypothetical protein